MQSNRLNIIQVRNGWIVSTDYVNSESMVARTATELADIVRVWAMGDAVLDKIKNDDFERAKKIADLPSNISVFAEDNLN